MSNFTGNNSLLCGSKSPKILLWDHDGIAPLSNGSGSWSATGGTNWVYGLTYGSWIDGSIAQFSGNSFGGPANTFNISVGSGIQCNGIIFNSHICDGCLTTLNGGSIDLIGSNPTITNTTTLNAIINSILTGSNGLIKNGLGVLVLGGINTYSGTTRINNGTIQVTGAGSIPSSSAIFIDNTAIFDINRNATISNNISGSGIIKRSSSSTGATLFTGNNTLFTGTYIQNPGIGYIAFAGDNSVGAPNVGFIYSSTAGGFYFTTSGNTLASTRTITLSGNCNLFWNGLSGNTNTIASLITGVGSVTKQSGETHILTNNNSYTGATNVRGTGSTAGAADSILRVSSGGSLGGTAGQTGDFGNIVFQDNNTNGILEFNTAANLGPCSQIRFRNTGGVAGYGGGLRYIGSTNETVNKTIQCDTGIGIRLESNSTGAGSITYNGTFSQTNRPLYLAGTGTGVLDNVFSGNGSVNKRGSGSWTLGGNNTYSGGTNITAGTLKAGVINAFGTGTITISAGATLDMNFLNLPNTIVNNGGSIINPPPTTSLLNHFDSSFSDSSSYSNTITNAGTASISSTQSKFGGNSVYLDGGTSSYLTVIPANSNIFDLRSTDYTMEMWVYPSSQTVSYPSIFGTNQWPTNNSMSIRFGCSTTGVSNAFSVVSGYDALNGGDSNILVSSTYATNNWYHVAYTRSGTTHRLFINGILVDTYIQANTNWPNMSGDGNLYIGSSWDGSSGRYIGYIDELRVTKGIALYTSNFTPPTDPF